MGTYACNQIISDSRKQAHPDCGFRAFYPYWRRCGMVRNTMPCHKGGISRHAELCHATVLRDHAWYEVWFAALTQCPVSYDFHTRKPSHELRIEVARKQGYIDTPGSSSHSLTNRRKCKQKSRTIVLFSFHIVNVPSNATRGVTLPLCTLFWVFSHILAGSTTYKLLEICSNQPQYLLWNILKVC